jgi:flagellar biosynthesis/type III secretory pathway chaperone
MPKASTRETKWKVVRTTATTKQAMKMSGSNSLLEEKKILLHKLSRLSQPRDNRLSESR